MSKVRLLGRSSIYDGEVWLKPPRGKTAALLFYLAYHHDWVSREELIYLFWPDTSDKQARSNLRALLARSVKPLDYVDNLEIERSSLRWLVESDVYDFKSSLENGDLRTAINSYQGSLLAQFSSDNIPEFDNWLELERAELSRMFQSSASDLSQQFEAEQNYASAVSIRKKLYAEDPLDEMQLRKYLKTLLLAQKASEALSIYQQFKQQLQTEYDAEPEEETLSLIKTILQALESQETKQTYTPKSSTNSFSTKEERATFKKVVGAPQHHSPFVGRDSEIKRVRESLTSDARLVTLIAPGGMGKTRLSLAVAKDLLASFSDGVYFVPCADLTEPNNIAYSLAKVLNFELQANADVLDQVVHHVKDKVMLIVLDNLEHLLDDLSLILALLKQSSQLKLLVTSREALNLSLEFVVDLGGLDVPQSHLNLSASEILKFGAVNLLFQHAKRHQKEIDLEDAVVKDMAQICQKLGGMPLAIELASAWLRHLTMAELNAELEEDLDLLETNHRDVTKQQHSVQQIFEQSWSRLRPKEQDALLKLAVFHGGFSRQAAKDITGVGLPILANLHNKAFFRTSEIGYYVQHQLLWQLLRSRLEKDKEIQNLRDKHSSYFMKFLAEQPDLDKILETKPIRQKVSRDFPNVKAAWLFAVDNNKEDLLELGLGALHDFFFYENRISEGMETYKYTLDNLDSQSIFHGKVYKELGSFQIWTRQFNKAQKMLEKAVKIFRKHNDKANEADALNLLGFLVNISSGDLPKTQEIMQQVYDLSSKVKAPFAHAISLFFLTLESSIIEREKAHRKGLQLIRDENLYSALPLFLRRLGDLLAFSKGEYQEALTLYQEAYDVLRQRKMPEIGEYLAQYASMCINAGSLKQAYTLAHEAIGLSKNFAEVGLESTADANYSLAHIAMLQGNYGEAQEYLKNSLLVIKEARDSDLKAFHRCRYQMAFVSLYLIQDELEQAEVFMKKALENYEYICKPTLAFPIQQCMIDLSIAKKDLDAAKKHFKILLETANQSRFYETPPVALGLFISYGNLLEAQGKHEQAFKYLQCAQNHPSSSYPTKKTAENRLQKLVGKELANKATDYDVLLNHLRNI